MTPGSETISAGGEGPLPAGGEGPLPTGGEGPLPTGTLTFLFTDIEGSTRLVQELGAERYGDVLELHRRLLREAIAANGGTEVSTDGDSFFVVFDDPAAALGTTADGQRALGAANWPHGIREVRVRMGLHTGDGVVAAGTYVGAAVNRAARIAAVAHGGQVVLSSVTRRLVEGLMLDGTRLRDLGEHRLKDLAEPERIAQLVIAGLPADFPPLRSLEAIPNNLPLQLTSFIGRDEDIVAVAELVRTARLVTLTGPGGTGKTRLALQVAADIADRYADGVWFVQLAPISDPSLVASTIAAAIGLRSVGARPIRDALVDRLRDEEALIVLDNVEQVVEAAPLVGDLLREAPRLRVLATSRIVLRLSGEQEVPLDALGDDEGVRLFVERARAVRPDFALTDENGPVVAEIVGRLDRLPLAIELAAARSRLLTPSAMLSRLDRRLDLLAADMRDLPARQRTIRGAIDWSYDLLDADLRRLFARLAVFVGGGTLDDIEAVIGGLDPAGVDVLAGLETLVEHSLVRRTEDGVDIRFVMLATIGEYALEKLAGSVEESSVRDRHAAHFLTVAENAAPQLTGTDQVRALDRLDAERDNLRAAMGHALDAADARLALRLCSSLWRYWQIRGQLFEGMERTREALAIPGAEDHPREYLSALDAAGGLTWWLGDYVACEGFYRRALDGHIAAGDERAIARAYYNLSFPTTFIGQAEAAVKLAVEARDRLDRLGDADGVARARWGLGIFALTSGDLETARRESEAAVEHFRGTSLRFDLGWALFGRGQVAYRQDELDLADRTWGEALRIFDQVADSAGVAMLLDARASLLARRGDRARAARLSGAVARLERTIGAGLMPRNRILRGYDPASLREDPETRDAWHAGENLSVDEAVADALGDNPR